MTPPSPELWARAAELGRSVLLRMRQPELLTGLEQPRPVPGTPALGWSALDMAFGDVGLAVAFGHLLRAEPDADWDGIAHA